MSDTAKNGLFTNANDPVAHRVSGVSSVGSIPLKDADTHSKGTGNISALVSDATSQVKDLVRSEIELAKAEVSGSAKKAGVGGGLLAGAAVFGLYALLFFFVFLGALLSLWLQPWAAWLIVFVILLVIAGILALIGVANLKKIKAPEKTQRSVKELKKLVPGKAQQQLASTNAGFYS